MSGFLRPGARAALARWREALIGLCVLAAGLYGAATQFGALLYLSAIAIPTGLALLWEGARRARFPAGGGGAGLVELDERQITYFAPIGGGAVSLDGLTRIEILATGRGASVSGRYWSLHAEDGTVLHIPPDAEGAGALYDALTALPGADFGAVTEAMETTVPDRFAIWTRRNPDRRLS